MSISLQTNALGLKRAERQFVESATRVSRLDLSPSAQLDPHQADTLELGGAARPRLFGARPPYVSSLAGEAVQQRQAVSAYRANISALKVSLELDDSLLALGDEPAEA